MTNRTPRQGGDDATLAERLREARGSMRQVDAAAASGVSQPQIARFEHGRQIPKPAQVESLCDAYAVPARIRRELVAEATAMRAGQRRVVLQRTRDVVQVQQEIRTRQQNTRMIRAFTPSGIPGLLQTPDYVRAIFGGDTEPGRIRLAGQDILDSDRQFAFLLPEGSLGWAMLPAEGMAAQLEHLAAMATRPNVAVGIIPWGQPAQVLPVNSWELYDEANVWTGTNTGSTLLEPPDVAPYVTLFGQLEAMAAFGDDAARLLAANAERYRRAA